MVEFTNTTAYLPTTQMVNLKTHTTDTQLPTVELPAQTKMAEYQHKWNLIVNTSIRFTNTNVRFANIVLQQDCVINTVVKA